MHFPTLCHKAWFDVLYEKVGVRSGVIHPGKHIPASAGKIQLGNYGKFWEELVEGRVEYLHDGTRPTSRCWAMRLLGGPPRTKSLKLLKHGKTFTRAAECVVWIRRFCKQHNMCEQLLSCYLCCYCEVVYKCFSFNVFLHVFWRSRIGGGVWLPAIEDMAAAPKERTHYNGAERINSRLTAASAFCSSGKDTEHSYLLGVFGMKHASIHELRGISPCAPRATSALSFCSFVSLLVLVQRFKSSPRSPEKVPWSAGCLEPPQLSEVPHRQASSEPDTAKSYSMLQLWVIWCYHHEGSKKKKAH